MFRFPILLFSCWVLLISSSKAENRQEIKSRISTYLQNGAVMLNDGQGTPLISINSKTPFVPASIIKIFTSEVALVILGENYRFETGFYLDSEQNLAVKGWGDPYLISEEIALIAGVLKKKGIKYIHQIFLDASSFKSTEIPGRSNTLNPYDALNGALVVNFNSLYLERKRNGEILSAEDVTPLTPLSKKKALQLNPGTRDRINLTGNRIESLQYVGELFRAILERAGIVVRKKEVKEITVGTGWRLLYKHQNSRKLSHMLQGLLKYSNNFIANQLFLTFGATQFGYPATLEKSRRALKEFIQKHYSNSNGEFVIDEASGLSRTNRITANNMMRVLIQFRPHYTLLSSKNGIWYKSGTLKGVSNYAGYFENKGKLFPYVIMLNQPHNSRDIILNLLKRYLHELK